MWKTLYYPCEGESTSSSDSPEDEEIIVLDDVPPVLPVEVESFPVEDFEDYLDAEGKNKLIQRRNENIEKNCTEEIHESWEDHRDPLNVSKYRMTEYLYEEFLPVGDKERGETAAEKCFNDTKQFQSCKKGKEEDKEYFDYFHFQKALQLQREQEDLTYLANNFDKEGPPMKTLPKKNLVTKEFQRMYGPIDKTKSVMVSYLENYLETIKENTEKLNSRLTFFSKLAKDQGKEKVLEILREEQLELETVRMSMTKGSENFSKIYDINPYTNSNHLEWFILPRPAMPHPAGLHISHPSLEKDLVEFQSPQQFFILNGYWPSVADYNLLYSASKYIPTDPVIATKMIPESFPGFLWGARYQRFELWRTLSIKIIERIEHFPMGIELGNFFETVRTKGRYLDDLILFPGMTYEEVVTKHITDLCMLTRIPASSTKDPKHIILFPAYLNGVMDDFKAVGILREGWDRILFLVRKNNDKLRVTDLPELIIRHFGTNPVWKAWGFGSTKFVQWCIAQWSQTDSYKVHLQDFGNLGHLLVHPKDQN